MRSPHTHEVETATLPRLQAAEAGEPYAVWAPGAREVVLDLDGRRYPMRPSEDGWWHTASHRHHGEMYAFMLDGEGPFPDPRSPWQPDGVHGRSRHVEHGRFSWNDARWQAPPLSSAVVYEMHVGTFSERGTFVGAIEHLPSLVDLGVTHVELMPVAQFSGQRGWGYDGVDLFAPHNAYGSPGDLKTLVDACHRLGLAVLLDVVYNHFGPCGNYLNRFGPYVTRCHTTPWGEALNLDGRGSDEVRRFVCENAIMWLRDYHMDGLRLDAVHALVDTSAVHILEELADAVDTLEAVLGRHFVLIAESDLNDPRVIRSRDAGGYELDAQWSDDFHHALHVTLTGERAGYYEDFSGIADVAEALCGVFVYAQRHSSHRGRRHGRPADSLCGSRFVVAAQNHDQIGNRAHGERLAHLVSVGRAKIAAALTVTSPYIPLLFQGEEWATSAPFQYFTSHEDDELGQRVCEGRRRELAAFGWDPACIPDPQAKTTFEQSRLRWSERTWPLHREMLDWYRALIALRRSTPHLADGNRQAVRVTCREGEQTLTMRRGSIVVACNLSAQRSELPLRVEQLLLASDAHVRVEHAALSLPAESVAIVRGV